MQIAEGDFMSKRSTFVNKYSTQLSLSRTIAGNENKLFDRQNDYKLRGVLLTD